MTNPNPNVLGLLCQASFDENGGNSPLINRQPNLVAVFLREVPERLAERGLDENVVRETIGWPFLPRFGIGADSPFLRW